MATYNWSLRVRVSGTRNGWHSVSITDTPAFELRSNAQYGGIWSDAETAALVARNMFQGLTQAGDTIHVIVTPADGTGDVHSFEYVTEGAK